MSQQNPWATKLEKQKENRIIIVIITMHKRAFETEIYLPLAGSAKK
jgi:hypothetical protein